MFYMTFCDSYHPAVTDPHPYPPVKAARRNPRYAEMILPALPILPSAALSSVSGGTTPLPSSALQADKIFSTGSIVSGWMWH